MERLLFVCTFLLLISTNSLVEAHENSEKFNSAQMGRGYEVKVDKVVIGGAKGSLLALTNQSSRDSFEEKFSKHNATEKITIQHFNDHRVSQEINSNFDLHDRHENWDLNSFEKNDRHHWEHTLDENFWTQKFDPKHLGWEDDGRYHFCTDPVPEPASYLMLLVGIAIVFGFMQRAKTRDK